MAEHDFIIDNGTGSAVRTDLNNVLQAIASNNSKSGALTTNYAYQWHVDTSDGNLKIRNAANNGYVTIGPVATTNFGLAPLAGATFTGKITHNYVTSVRMPSGDTSDRGSSANGDFRYNSETHKFEGYQNGAWGDIGGGGGATGGGTEAIFHENENQMDQDYTIGDGTANINAGVFGPLTINAVLTIPSGSVVSIV